MRWLWWWQRGRRPATGSEGPMEVFGTEPVPDGDVYPVPGYPRWAELLRESDPTRVLPVVGVDQARVPSPVRPLMTRAARWRSRRNAGGTR